MEFGFFLMCGNNWIWEVSLFAIFTISGVIGSVSVPIPSDIIFLDWRNTEFKKGSKKLDHLLFDLPKRAISFRLDYMKSPGAEQIISLFAQPSRIFKKKVGVLKKTNQILDFLIFF